MTVKELIEALGAFPEDLPVVVDCCQGGLDGPRIRKVWMQRVTWTRPENWGEWEETTDVEDPAHNPPCAAVVVGWREPAHGADWAFDDDRSDPDIAARMRALGRWPGGGR